MSSHSSPLPPSDQDFVATWSVPFQDLDGIANYTYIAFTHHWYDAIGMVADAGSLALGTAFFYLSAGQDKALPCTIATAPMPVTFTALAPNLYYARSSQVPYSHSANYGYADFRFAGTGGFLGTSAGKPTKNQTFVWRWDVPTQYFALPHRYRSGSWRIFNSSGIPVSIGDSYIPGGEGAFVAWFQSTGAVPGLGSVVVGGGPSCVPDGTPIPTSASLPFHLPSCGSPANDAPFNATLLSSGVPVQGSLPSANSTTPAAGLSGTPTRTTAACRWR